MDLIQVMLPIFITKHWINIIQRLASALDRPLFPWKKLILGFSLAQYTFESYLSFRQYKVLKVTRPPKVLSNEVSREVFDKSQVR